MRIKALMIMGGAAIFFGATPLYAQIDSVIDKAIGGAEEAQVVPQQVPPAGTETQTATETDAPQDASQESEPEKQAASEPDSTQQETSSPAVTLPAAEQPEQPQGVQAPQAIEEKASPANAPVVQDVEIISSDSSAAAPPEEEPEEELPPEPPPMTDMPVVQLRALDKITARTSTFQANVDSTVKFGSLYMKPRACRKASPLEKPESASFLQIWEMNKDGEAQWVFSGWMFASSPGLSAMDHPIYDVWVLDCLPKKDASKEDKSEKAEQQKRGEGEISDTEIPVELETRAED